MKKIALVMEGGGMRGAYTAGCLSWLVEHGIVFDNHYGISTGAIYLSCFLLEDRKYLYDMSTDYIADKEIIGIRPFLREGTVVGYNYLFDHILKEDLKFDMEKVIQAAEKKDAKIGLYDLGIDKTIYIPMKDLDKDMKMLQGSVTLPVIGHIVKVGDKEYLDGGITDMIPIEQAIRDGNDKFLVITTKPAGYVRKAANWFLRTVMRLTYPGHKQIYEDYKIRHIHYNEQIALIKQKAENGEAVWLLPSESVPVKRMSGDKESLRKLFDIGYQDAEKRKEEIFRLFQEE